MIGGIMRIFFSLIISLVTAFVPRGKYQDKLETLPTVAQLAEGYDLNGWTYQRIHSNESGIDHYFYSYPSQNDTLPVLLMLHGFNTDGRMFQKLTSLAGRFRLIAYNFPGESRFYRGKFKDFVFLLDDFCGALEIDSVCVAGNSVGGAIALCYAASSRTHINRLLLVSSEVFGMTEDDRRRSEAMAKKLLKYPDYKLYYLLEKTRALLRG
ncbi:MAG: alpha/beta fold hydrolase, partial [Chitinivibrionales bacterium]|nr:alpha/beta fold hydrolase [Chitinivibrionales bacterium]MBD3358919.1 alpha/beta fold hydrolase [Chitinivibrionales bacterium]